MRKRFAFVAGNDGKTRVRVSPRVSRESWCDNSPEDSERLFHHTTTIWSCNSSAAIQAQWEMAMSSLCKLMFMTGPLSFPTSVALGIVLQNNVRTQVSKMDLIPDDEIQMTSFTFDDEEFVPFESQLELGMNAVGDGHDLGIAVINDTDASKGETTTRFHPGPLNGPFYELTYKVLPD